MAKFTSIVIATVALLAGVQAACPPNGFFCGSELIDVYKCKSHGTSCACTCITNNYSNV
jgi:hypothetical protein